MKKLITLILVVLSGSVYCQIYHYIINFEDTSQFYRLKIDTLSNPNNCWQIGKPQKTIFADSLTG